MKALSIDQKTEPIKKPCQIQTTRGRNEITVHLRLMQNKCRTVHWIARGSDHRNHNQIIQQKTHTHRNPLKLNTNGIEHRATHFDEGEKANRFLLNDFSDLLSLMMINSTIFDTEYPINGNNI